MTAEDLFGLILRVAGVVFIGFGFLDVLHAVALATGLPIPSRGPIPADLAGAATWLAMGAVLFFGADAITRVAYRGRRDPG